MKIEKLSDTQIRCTLNKQDLSDRELQLSELAYGSEKAKALFSELMLQANFEYGFEANNTPLMIEAIPINQDTLVLLVTKVESPEELDTRFSQMSTPSADFNTSPLPSSSKSMADEIIAAFGQLSSLLSQAVSDTDKKKKDEVAAKAPNPAKVSRCFTFGDLSQVIRLSKVLAPFYQGRNTLYKDEKTSRYILVLRMTKHTPQDFNKVCNVAAEYGVPVTMRFASESLFEEQYKKIIAANAIKKLAEL